MPTLHLASLKWNRAPFVSEALPGMDSGLLSTHSNVLLCLWLPHPDMRYPLYSRVQFGGHVSLAGSISTVSLVGT